MYIHFKPHDKMSVKVKGKKRVWATYRSEATVFPVFRLSSVIRSKGSNRVLILIGDITVKVNKPKTRFV